MVGENLRVQGKNHLTFHTQNMDFSLICQPRLKPTAVRDLLFKSQGSKALGHKGLSIFISVLLNHVSVKVSNLEI